MNGKAKVGDKLNRNDIPDNVTDMGDEDTDEHTGYGRWVRSIPEPTYWSWIVVPEQRDAARRAGRDRGVPASEIEVGNLHVLAVDNPYAPETPGAHRFQPDGTGFCGYRDGDILCGRPRQASFHQPGEATGDTAYTLPDIPAAVIAFTGAQTGHRWERHPVGWTNGTVVRSLGDLFDREGTLTPILRKARRWPKYSLGVTDHPAIVSVEQHGRWRRRDGDGLYVQTDTGERGYRGPRTLEALTIFGDVAEVFDAQHP